MGNLVFGCLVVFLYGAIIYRLLRRYQSNQSICHSCRACPMSGIIEQNGNIDLLTLVQEMDEKN